MGLRVVLGRLVRESPIEVGHISMETLGISVGVGKGKARVSGREALLVGSRCCKSGVP